MRIDESLLKGYEQTRLVKYNELKEEDVHYYKDLAKKDITGVLKANYYDNDNNLTQLYSNQENHVGVIASTRCGKTTEYVIPTILSFAKQKTKRRMIISDPKGELYRTTAETLRKEGYNVKLFNFRDYLHSEYWNPLTPIYRMYHKVFEIEEEVKLVKTDDGYKNSFRDVIYDSQDELDTVIERVKRLELENVSNEIDKIASITISKTQSVDPYWEDSARILLMALLWAMLEDSVDKSGEITEDNFSFSTAISIMDGMSDGGDALYDDGGYFSNRDSNSKALMLAKNCILENAQGTRKCVVSTFNTKMAIYKASSVRLITSCNSFEMEELVDDVPIAIFVVYRDELKSHYQIISSFIQTAYTYLIEYSCNKPNGKLDVPFYFILDEFGNFPKINDYETVVSASAGRNIWFIVILQSYSQLDNVYGPNTAEIIRDNLNVHIFLGSNNPKTLTEFKKECGEITRISPLSAFNGSKETIDHYHIETIPLIPKSFLSDLKRGECIVTEANCGYVLFSKFEPYYLCDEFKNLPLSYEKDYKCDVNPLDEKYYYKEFLDYDI